MSKIQLRGHCQVCGRLQAATNGHVAAHGYTVELGWFSGTCSGAAHRPMEEDVTVTTRICEDIRKDCAALVATATAYRRGESHPKEWQYSRRPKAPATPWEEIPEYARQGILETAAYRLERRAEIGENVAKSLEKLVAEVHGKALVEVKVEAGPAPVVIGEKRMGSNGMVLQATSIQGARVYWDGWRESTCADKPLKSWTGSAAWRRLAIVD
jgi:hypothetical protein